MDVPEYFHKNFIVMGTKFRKIRNQVGALQHETEKDILNVILI